MNRRNFLRLAATAVVAPATIAKAITGRWPSDKPNLSNGPFDGVPRWSRAMRLNNHIAGFVRTALTCYAFETPEHTAHHLPETLVPFMDNLVERKLIRGYQINQWIYNINPYDLRLNVFYDTRPYACATIFGTVWRSEVQVTSYPTYPKVGWADAT